MIGIIKNWINVLLCLGIFMMIAKLFLPKNKIRKYVLSLMGVMSVIAILSPVIDVFKSGELERSIKSVISNIDATSANNIDTQNISKSQTDTVKQSFVNSIKADITNKLKDKGITVNKIEIFMSDNYDIEKLEINIKKGTNGTSIDSVNTVVKYVKDEYKIEYSKIEVVEE